mmetsp:Transcript_42648/g.91480  ORF Transcript_42648/g.91480 Transcript_42648/m.91480 type:complete len:129 (+) Transcript_42648:238-624(+)
MVSSGPQGQVKKKKKSTSQMKRRRCINIPGNGEAWRNGKIETIAEGDDASPSCPPEPTRSRAEKKKKMPHRILIIHPPLNGSKLRSAEQSGQVPRPKISRFTNLGHSSTVQTDRQPAKVRLSEGWMDP